MSIRKNLAAAGISILISLSIAGAEPVSDGIYQFDLICNFLPSACQAQAQVRLFIHGDAECSVNQPQWSGNCLVISCPGEERVISAGEATLVRLGYSGYGWRIENSSQSARLLLDGHPFDPGGANATAKLEIGDRASALGACVVTARQIGDR